MAKVSKNARKAKGIPTATSGKDFVKLVRSIKDPKTGVYSFKELIVHKDRVQEILANK
jgi:hypothetical protein